MSKKDESIGWMYEGAKSGVNREDYLLGKKVDKNFEKYSDVVNEQKAEYIDSLVRTRTIAPVSTGIKTSSLQKDIIKSEDPFVAVKVREETKKRELMDNPLMKLKLQRMLKSMMTSKEEKKKDKKKKKKRSRSSSSSDSDSDGDKRKSKKSKRKDSSPPSKISRQDSHRSDDRSSRRRMSDADARDKHRRDHDDRRTRRSRSRSEERSERAANSSRRERSRKHSNSPRRDRSRSVERKRQRSRSPRRNRSRERDEMKKSRRSSRDRRSRSNERREKRSRSPRRDKSRSRSPKRENRKRSSSPKRTSDDRKNSHSERKERHKSKDSSDEWEADDQPSSSSKRCFDSHIPEHLRQKSRHDSNDSESDSEKETRRNKYDDEEKSELKNSYGLVEMRKRSEKEKEEEKNAPIKELKCVKLPIGRGTNVNKKKEPRRTLTEEEKAARLAEMQDNVKWREDLRSKNFEKQKKEDTEEKEELDKNGYAPSFIRNQMRNACDDMTVEKRLQSNKKGVQRGHDYMGRSFAKK